MVSVRTSIYCFPRLRLSTVVRRRYSHSVFISTTFPVVSPVSRTSLFVLVRPRVNEWVVVITTPRGMGLDFGIKVSSTIQLGREETRTSTPKDVCPVAPDTFPPVYEGLPVLPEDVDGLPYVSPARVDVSLSGDTSAGIASHSARAVDILLSGPLSEKGSL